MLRSVLRARMPAPVQRRARGLGELSPEPSANMAEGARAGDVGCICRLGNEVVWERLVLSQALHGI